MFCRHQRGKWDKSKFFHLPSPALHLLYSPNHEGIITEDLLLSRLQGDRCLLADCDDAAVEI
jgi:hypothetical protein